jgi:hypothetical protein
MVKTVYPPAVVFAIAAGAGFFSFMQPNGGLGGVVGRKEGKGP